MKTTSSEHVVYTNFVFVLTFRTIFAHNMFSPCSELVVFMYLTGKSMNNHLSYCGLVDPRISASDKDLPVPLSMAHFFMAQAQIKGIVRTSLFASVWRSFSFLVMGCQLARIT